MPHATQISDAHVTNDDTTKHYHNNAQHVQHSNESTLKTVLPNHSIYAKQLTFIVRFNFFIEDKYPKVSIFMSIFINIFDFLFEHFYCLNHMSFSR